MLESLTLVEVTSAVFDEAGRLGPPSLSSLDASHLAAALDLADDLEGLVTWPIGEELSCRAVFVFGRQRIDWVHHLTIGAEPPSAGGRTSTPDVRLVNASATLARRTAPVRSCPEPPELSARSGGGRS